MWLGAGLLVALAAGAAVAGWWLLAGIALAGLLAGLQVAGSATVHPRAEWLLDGARTAARLAGVPLFAAAFAGYLVPRYSALTALGVVLLVTAVDAAGFTLPRPARGWLLGVLLAAAAGLVAVCLAIPPAPAVGGTPPFSGAFAAAAVFFPLLTGGRGRGGQGRKKAWWLAGSVAVALAVCAAALYQMGGVRLGLSRVPLRDLLAAGDAQALLPLLAGVVVIATVPAALGALAQARARFSVRPVASMACGAVAAVGAVLLEPVEALLLAAALALAEVLVAGLLTLSARRWDVRAVLSVLLAIVLLARIPPGYLLLAVVFVAVAAVIRRSARPRRPSEQPRTTPE
ncbi:hypothetical protein [Amycolatopsis taiwanensis]|uniref:hypothetical protein n=1 Tax=Amycolatopsis taiwanensis TaxID=342230 RepID=UPI0004B9CEF3|nr:hypothetical protein [Amycolatopsis taiwanensis]